jgi:hypothetical protein
MVFTEGCMEVIDQLCAVLGANCSRLDGDEGADYQSYYYSRGR